MSLLDDARGLQNQSGSKESCKLSMWMGGLDSVKFAEVVELLTEKGIAHSVKFAVLSGEGVSMSQTTLFTKLTLGCSCKKCQDTFGSGGFAV